MKIKDILKKQGEIYCNLPSNKTIQKYKESIKPKPVKLVPYYGYEISEQEYKAITELEKLLNKEATFFDIIWDFNFEISIENNKITYLKARNQDLKYMPEQINNLPNLTILVLDGNQISEIKNLDNLRNLRMLFLENNKITEIKGLDNLTNLKNLYLFNNQITEIKNLNKLTNLKEFWIGDNPIKNKEEIKNLKNKGMKVF